MQTDNITEFYESESKVYDRRWEKEGGKATYESQMDIVSGIIQNWKNFNVLEVGCGSGRFSVKIAEIAASVTYLDLTSGMLKQTRGKLKHTGYSFNGINASAYGIPLASNTTDAIISINVFNHLDDPSKVLREFFRVLNQDGKLLLNFTNLFSYYFPFGLFINRKHRSIGRDVYSIWSIPTKTLSMLNSNGFIPRRVIGHTFVPHHIDKPVLRILPILLDRLSRDGLLKWVAPSLFYYCEKTDISRSSWIPAA